jgi:hypothetical protein
MAQRATGFAKRPAASLLTAAPARVALAPIPLKLIPRVAPYKKHGRLSLRIERMPQGSRLSAGRNNGNNSWSLALDELEDLDFFPAEGALDIPTLALRIVGGEDGETLALLELQLVASAAPPLEALVSTFEPAAPATVVNAGAVEQLRRLHEEMAQVKTDLAARDAEIAQARSVWKAEEDARFAMAQAKWQEDTARAVNEAHGQTISLEGRHTAEILRLRQEVSTVRKSLIDCEDDLLRTKSEFAREQNRQNQETSETLTQAKARWESEEAARFAKAEALWREQTTRAVSEAKSTVVASDARSEAELARLRDELGVLRNTLVEQDRALAAARQATEKARLDSQREVSDAVARAEAKAREAEGALRANGNEQISEVEARLRREHAAALVEAGARAERAEAALAQANAAAARGETLLSESESHLRREHAAVVAEAGARAERAEAALVQANAAVTRNENLLADAKARAEQAEASLAQASSNAGGALADASARAQRAEAALIEAKTLAETAVAAAHSRIAQIETALAETNARASAAEAALAEARALAAGDRSQQEIERLRAEVTAADSRFKAREQEYATARTELETIYVRERQELLATQARTERAWREDETARIAEAIQQHGEDQTAQLGEAVSRYESAEAALAAQRIRSGDPAHRDDSELNRLRDENVLLKAEIQSARDTIERNGLDSPASGIALQKPKRNIARDLERKETGSALRLVRDLGIAGGIAVGIFLGLPRIEPMLPYDWQVAIAGISGQVSGLAGQQVKVAAAAPASAAKAQNTAVVTHGANLRATPSSKAAVVMTLSRGAHVSLGKTRGSWTEATIFDGADLRRGWVFSAYLKNAEATPQQ